MVWGVSHSGREYTGHVRQWLMPAVAALSHATSLVDRTAHRFNDARKLEEQPFTRGLDDGAPQLKDALAVMHALPVFRVPFLYRRNFRPHSSHGSTVHGAAGRKCALAAPFRST